MSLSSLFLLSLSFYSVSFSQARVPSNATFKFINHGEFGPLIVEYNANYRALDVFNSPFQLCFYNTTPNAFTLALRMATTRSESVFRWVWEANRSNPVRENATLTFGADGNLVLADSDGRVAWQTNTGNRGVVGFKLLPNGNMVLHDSRGNSVWQSFEHPTDTLLVGQSLKAGGVTELVSRLSEKQNMNGAFSLVMEPGGVKLYYKSRKSARPLLYFSLSKRFSIFQNGPLESVTLKNEPETDEGFAYDITLEYQSANTSLGRNLVLSRPKYNSTLSFLRLGIDGNVKIYTYYDNVDWGAWEVSFSLFDRESTWENECQLPDRCGVFGVCENNQCVACPLSKGLMSWSKNCQPEKVRSCRESDFHYYKVVGVDHFLCKYTRGVTVQGNGCRKICSKDCKCLGYFYNQQTSRCWIAHELKTLTKVAKPTHVGYIKAPNH